MEADAALKRLSHIYPNDSVVIGDVRRRNHENWGNVLKKNSLRETADNLEQWIDQDPRVREYYVELVQTYVKLGEYEKAIGAANRGLAHFPNDYELINKEVGIMVDLGLYTQALAFAKSKKVSSTIYNNLLSEVATDARMRDPYEANGRLFLTTHDRDALNYLINTSLTRGYYEDARVYLDEAMKLDGRTPALLMKLYGLEKAVGDDKRCERILLELYMKQPEDEELLEDYTDMMLRLSDRDIAQLQWDDAYDHLLRALDIMPDSADAWPAAVSRQIMVLGHLGRREDAGYLCRQASAKRPDESRRFASAYEDIAAGRLKMLVEEERFEEAMTEAEALLDAVPGSEAALRCLINMSQTLKRKDDFHRYAEMGIKAYPESPYFIVKQAVALQEQGRNSEALALLRPRRKDDEYVNPQLAAAFSGISQEWATQLLKNRMPDIALQVIDSALVYNPGDRDLLYSKGVAYEYMKDFAKACEFQSRNYEPSNAEQEEFTRHMRYLSFRGFKNRVDATYTRAFFDTRDGDLSSVAHLYSIASVTYARVAGRNTYTGQVSYKGLDGYHDAEEEEVETGGVGLEFMAQWEHEFNARWSGMASVAFSTRFFNKVGANVSASYAAPRGWTPTLRLGYRRTPPTYLYLGGSNTGLYTNEQHDLFIVAPSVEKAWERIRLTTNADLSILSGSVYYNVGLKGKLFFNGDNVSSVSLLTGFGSFPELTFFEQTALRNVSHTNAMVGLDFQYLCSRHLCLGLTGSWNTCYNPYRREDGSLLSAYRNIFSLTAQVHVAF